MGGFLRPLHLDDVVLLLGSLSQLDALYGFWLDVSTLPQHADLLLGLEELWLEKSHGLEKEGVVEALASCTNLRTLGLHDCALGELPQAFPQLTRMRYLDLSNTDVSLRVVEALCDLSGLQQLHLSRAPRLTSLPDSISRLTGLYSLSLLESKVTRLPDSMTAMSSLRELAWGGRQLQLDVVWRLTGLNTLALSDATAPSLPIDLGQLTGLSALLVEGEALAALPDGLSKLVGLERLT
jgi:Leucine-rich repeat (LRR) protein